MTRSHLVAGLGALSVAGLIAAAPAFAQTSAERLEQLLHELQTQLKFESEDGNFKAWIHGRLLADYANYEEDKSKLDDDTEFRTAQFSLNGTLYRDWVFKAQVDVARETPNVKDLYLRYNFKPHSITVGQFKQPFGLERLTSSRFITFMERALPSAFAIPRLIGLGYQTHGPNWSFALAGGGSDVSSKISHQGDEGYSVTSRVHFAPLSEKTENVHLGAALSYRKLNDDTFRFRQRPESHVTSARFVDTGNIASASDLFLYILEAATVWGPFSLQGEYTNATVEREAGLSDVDFYGWYGYVSFFLTPGDHRSYDPKKGAFGRVKPKRPFSEGGGYGALELGVRYSGILLTDEDILGGGERNLTVGLNWYATSHIRFMLNYINVNNDNNATGNLANLLPQFTSAASDDPHIIQLRAQFDL